MVSESYKERVYWNAMSYGSSFVIPKKFLVTSFVFLCFITPFTNWMIPLVNKIIKRDLVIRYE